MRSTGVRSLFLFLFAIAACGGGDRRGATPEPVELHTDDFDAILARGYLRVLVEGADEAHLPRSGDPLLQERDLARKFGQRHGIAVRFVPLDTFSSLLPALASGAGDIVAANLTITTDRQNSFAFTVPVDQSQEILILPAMRDRPESADVIRGRIGVRAGTSFEETAHELARTNPALVVVSYPGSVSHEDLLDSLAAGALDFSILDGNRLEMFLGYRSDIQAGGALTARRPLAWATRRQNPSLLAALDDFLHEERLLGSSGETYIADLPEIRERRKIRMITRNNAATYFLWRGRVMGFEYELAHKFAEEQGLRLEVVVAPTYDDMLPMLRAGEGDFVAAFLNATPERIEDGISFSRPYHFATEVVVGRATEDPMTGPADLSGRRIAVRRSSSYWTRLAELRGLEGIDFELVEAPATMETEAILAAVAAGTYDLTVSDSHLLELEMTLRDDLAGLLQITEPMPHSWAVHPANTELMTEINAFFTRHYRGLFFNVVYEKYFGRPEQFGSGWEDGGAADRLSPYDDIVRELAGIHGFDWRLTTAQMYQESRFDPGARSWAGARGLMQVLPRTAAELGITGLEDPRTGIEAGLRYMTWVWDRFPDHLESAEHMWFTLAGYNAGHGHVRDARRLARQLELDPDRWFGNVEVAMLKLSQAEYARQARHGFVRGREPVGYVRGIRERYRAYVELLGGRISDR